MTIEEIRRIIEGDETRTLELKKSTGELKEGMHSACAFLNTDGGWLIFGVTPKSLKIVGQEVTDNTRREIAQALNGLLPTIDIKVEYIDVTEHTGNQIIAIHFDSWKYGMVPYTYNGRPYYKVESTTRIMPRDMFEERLKESNPRFFAWDSQTAPGITIDDLDENMIRNAVRGGVIGGRINISAEGLDIRTILGKFKLLNGENVTNAGVVLFGKDVDDFPQLMLRMARFRGLDKNEFIDERRLSGNFFELLDSGMDFCFKHLNLSGKIVGLLREEHLEVPMEALREALTNALCHRAYDNYCATTSLAIYDDRVEIVNPGKLPAPLTTESIKSQHESYPRNFKIARVLYLSNYLENWGSGIKRMVDLCREQNVPEPEFTIREATVVVTFRRASYKNVTQNDTQNDTQNKHIGTTSRKSLKRQRQVANYISNNPYANVEELSTHFDVSIITIKRDIKTIGIKWVGPSKTGHWEIGENTKTNGNNR